MLIWYVLLSLPYCQNFNEFPPIFRMYWQWQIKILISTFPLYQNWKSIVVKNLILALIVVNSSLTKVTLIDIYILTLARNRTLVLSVYIHVHRNKISTNTSAHTQGTNHFHVMCVESRSLQVVIWKIWLTQVRNITNATFAGSRLVWRVIETNISRDVQVPQQQNKLISFNCFDYMTRYIFSRLIFYSQIADSQKVR